MKIQCWSVGKANEAYVEEGIAMFSKRIQHYFPIQWQLIGPVKGGSTLSAEDLKRKESDQILKLIQKDDFLVLLDERGLQLRSEEVSTMIQRTANASHKNMVFLIGGAFGVDKSIFDRANFTWSLSKLVFPHQLVRLMLAEQIYRACTIMRNESYHHI